MVTEVETPLKPDTDYFDATASILALAESHRQMGNRITDLEKLLRTQGEINGKLLENMNQLLLRVGDLEAGEEKTSSIILPRNMRN